MATSRIVTILLGFALGAPAESAPEHEKLSTPPAGARIRYGDARARIAKLRTTYAAALARAKSKDERNSTLDDAGRDVLDAITHDILPPWYGTRWSYSGTSTVPGSGSIACGMFVGTVLNDAGFNLDRIAIGRLASEHIALSLTREANIRRYSDRPARVVEDDLLERGEGLYLVGLDLHAGLAWVDGDGHAYFIHSSVYPPGAVTCEPLVGDNPFSYSRYRVVARLLDREMMARWVRGARFEAVTVRSRSR